MRTLAVQMHGKRIGLINRLGSDQHLFAFEDDYINDPERPTLSLSFKGRGGALITKAQTATLKLPPFFSNLLPEGHLRTHLAAQAGIKPQREFFLLAVLGADLPGALLVTPLDEEGRESDVPDDEIRDEHVPGTVLRFSLAGVQLKFSAVAEARGGLTIPVDGMGGSWIVKLPSIQYR
ncbi:MAG TPA: HipA N-terminal domain-containing protein, partial [Candidatus Krumholzibacteria bacterium]